MTAVQWLILTLALVVIVPIIWMASGHFLRRRDFRRQVEGKRPERHVKKNMRLPRNKTDVNTDMDMDRLVFESKMKQNRHGW